MSYAVIPIKDYVETCDAIREKTGSAEKIKSGEMPERINDVFKAGQLDTVSNAEALKGTASETDIVAISDISPVEHNVPCRVESKNFWSHGDVSVSRAVRYAVDLPAGNYTLSGDITTDNTSAISLLIYDSTKSTRLGFIEANSGVRTSSTFTLTERCTELLLYSNYDYASSAGVIAEYKNMMIEKGSTATAFTPYVEDLSAVTVNRYGKNLLDTSNVVDATYAKLTCETVGNGHIKINGTKYGLGVSTIKTFDNPITLPKGIYTFSMKHISGTLDVSTVGFYLTIGGTDYSGGSINGRDIFTNNKVITLTEEAQLTNIKLYAYQDNAVYTDFTVALLLEKNSTATDYEPYIEPTEYSAIAEGTVEGITSLSPNMTLISDTEGVIISAEYIKDIDKAFGAVTTAVALTGGE